jgi:hypothetical protein
MHGIGFPNFGPDIGKIGACDNQIGDLFTVNGVRRLETAPNMTDSDSDGFSDPVEIGYGLNTTNPDTDGDGLRDNVDPDPCKLPSVTPPVTKTPTPTPTTQPTPTKTPTPRATSVSASVSLASGSSKSVEAACPSGSVVTGGGFAGSQPGHRHL